MQTHSTTLARDLDAIAGAFVKISVSVEALLSSRRPNTGEAREFEQIIDAVDEITASLDRCAVALVVPDVFPEDWCEGGDAT